MTLHSTFAELQGNLVKPQLCMHTGLRTSPPPAARSVLAPRPCWASWRGGQVCASESRAEQSHAGREHHLCPARSLRAENHLCSPHCSSGRAQTSAVPPRRSGALFVGSLQPPVPPALLLLGAPLSITPALPSAVPPPHTPPWGFVAQHVANVNL